MQDAVIPSNCCQKGRLHRRSTSEDYHGGDVSTTNSTPYDGSVSSGNDGCSVFTPHKHMELSPSLKLGQTLIRIKKNG